jgi:excinuclease ABC subunit A
MRKPPKEVISIHGAREHNLKNISLEIPRHQFVVVTGVSGSGKSTLAFDLLFAEGQRRFLDSMNVYARQFIDQMARPDVDLITGIPPTVSIEQRASRGGGKSTVATVTEIYHFLRLLYARIGVQYCPDCQIPVQSQTREAIQNALGKICRRDGPLTLLAPVARNRKGFHNEVAEWASANGYASVRADGKIRPSGEPMGLDRFRDHNVEIVTGGFAPGMSRISAGALVEETLRLGKNTLFALGQGGQLTVFSTEHACPQCARSFNEPDPRAFSYNSSYGWCPKCRGFGELFYLPDVERGARADAIEESWFDWQEGKRELCPECRGARLNPEARAVRLHPAAGVLTLAEPGASSDYRGKKPAKTAAPTIVDLSRAPVGVASEFFAGLKFAGREAEIARDILPEIRERLKFLEKVGLGYLQLGRSATTLSGGEAQRIRLAAQLGSNLSGVLYILDEPTIGLHARDNERLLAALRMLKERGNSLLVVEHDEETMRQADHIIDLGPGAGIHGGRVVASGTLKELARHPESLTGQMLRRRKTYPTRGERRAVVATVPGPPASLPAPGPTRGKSGRQDCPPHLGDSAGAGFLELRGARVNNLKNLAVRLPLNRFIAVTGVSGSGKSTLIRECLLPALQRALKGQAPAEGAAAVSGFKNIRAVYEVDQAPIGRTPRSIPATYVGFFDDIRAVFARTPEARMRGFLPGRFSFNSAQGRCPECEGSGSVKLEMNFLPPAYMRCETCQGGRFNQETLEVEYRGKNIAGILDLSVAEALEFFAAHPGIRRPLEALRDTGLEYLRLGQISPTLSGGEAQRIKLVTHLLTGLKENPSRPERPGRSNLFILEEPTIGLHIADVDRLIGVLQRLVDAGHTVVVIEHNLDLIAEADWVIDLGPEAGDAGGELVAEGTPEQIAVHPASLTGRFLRKVLSVK